MDIDEPKLLIRATEIEYDDYKPNGSKKRVYEVQDVTKTEAGMRDIILPEVARNTIRRIRLAATSDEFAFADEKGRRYKEKSMYNALRTACKALGIPLRSTHPVRKTYATAMLDAGVPTKIVQNQLGHRDISTTEKYYHKDRATKAAKKQHINKVINM